METSAGNSPKSHSVLSISNNAWSFSRWKNLSMIARMVYGMKYAPSVSEKKAQQYFREHRSMVYSNLMLGGKLYNYLTDIDIQTQNMLNLL